MNYNDFLASIIMMQEYFGKKLSDQVIDLYWSNLKRISVEQFKAALENIMSTFHPSSTVPFPLVSDFMESLGLSGESRAHAAIVAVKNAAEKIGSYSSVDFGDPALHAVINRFGGWPEIANWANHGKWEFQEKNFMRAYIAAYESGEKAGPVMGHFEIDNMQKDWTTWNETQKKIGEVSKIPERLQWIGADFSQQLENKSENNMIYDNRVQKMIDSIG
jgi:Domain of unknown function (DUF6475)